MVINSDGAPKAAPKTVEEQIAEDQQQERRGPVKRADTPLVPVAEPGGIEQPITSAPVSLQPGMSPNDYQRSDATAVSATEYAELAKRAQAEKKQAAAALDPRSITGPAYRPPPRRVTPPPSSTTAASNNEDTSSSPPVQRASTKRTRPVPEYQPIPNIVSEGTARLSLMVGADGRVKDISIDRALQRNTGQLISAVQTWRFKPATENGNPIAAPYSVEISFKQ
jgi:TonB family protein